MNLKWPLTYVWKCDPSVREVNDLPRSKHGLGHAETNRSAEIADTIKSRPASNIHTTLRAPFTLAAFSLQTPNTELFFTSPRLVQLWWILNSALHRSKQICVIKYERLVDIYIPHVGSRWHKNIFQVYLNWPKICFCKGIGLSTQRCVGTYHRDRGVFGGQERTVAKW